MVRAVALTVVIAILSLGGARAEELSGVIKQIDKEKLTFVEGKKGAEPRTYNLAKEVKVFRFVSKTQKEPDPDGLKAEPLSNLPKGGVLAVINVVDGQVAEISMPSKKKK